MNALSPELQSYAGRIIDIDTHEMIPVQEWVKTFGASLQPMVDYFLKHAEPDDVNLNSSNAPGYSGDTNAIADDIINVKGCRAPGAVRPERRIEVMDTMGVARQLMFPTGLGVFASALYKRDSKEGFLSVVKGDPRPLAKAYFGLYNEWVVDVAKVSPRIKPVALLYGDTPGELIERTQTLLKSGIRAVWYLPASEAPGGRSPAHPDLDPLWAVLAEANCAFTMHIETDSTPLKAKVWQNAPAFEGYRSFGEFNSNPAFLSQFHLPYENFLTVMLLGGVFDRHPNLRVGIVECGSSWVGPMLRRLDLWHGMSGKMDLGVSAPDRGKHQLKHAPSYYIKKNIRVTPFPFEDVAFDIEQYDLAKVLCFSTDYPHVEGGKDAFSNFYGKVKKFGPQVAEDFFVTNGTLLLPA